MAEIIRLNEVCYAYHEKVEALKNINLVVNKGDMLAIIGQNGSGKSTLLNIINALVFPDSGGFFFDGQLITEKSMKIKDVYTKLRKSMGYVFQNSDLQLFCPTVKDELLFAPLQLNYSHKDAEERIEETLAYLGIEYLKDRPVLMLSGGEKKKVAIASILVVNPEVILFDEPLSALDPKTQTLVTELLLQLNQAGKTIIFTTHQLELIDHLKPRVAVLSEAHKIEKTGTATEILQDEEFLLSVNLIHEHVHKHGDEVHKHLHSHYIFHKH